MLAFGRYRLISALTIALAAIAVPRNLMVMAGGANFERLSLASGFDRAAAIVMGHTGGSYSLSSIANTDRRNQPCIGYGDPNPDHIIVLSNNFPQLTLQVDNGGKAATIVVRGPDRSTVRCGISNSNVSIADSNWQAGQYEVWIGSMEPNQRWNYRLSAQQ